MSGSWSTTRALPADADSYERLVLVFDGDDDDALAAARGVWTDSKARGFEVDLLAGRRARALAAAAIADALAINDNLKLSAPDIAAQPWSCRKVMVGQVLADQRRDPSRSRATAATSSKAIAGLACCLAPLLAGCWRAWICSSDLLSKDADWFSRSGRVFIQNVSIETPPLTPDKPVDAGRSHQRRRRSVPAWRRRRPATPMRWPTALPAPPPSRRDASRSAIPNATWRAASARPTTSISPTIARGDRVAVVTYSRGPRAGIYTFTAGRLSSIERGAEPAPQPKPRPRPKSRSRSRAATLSRASANRFASTQRCSNALSAVARRARGTRRQPVFLGALQRASPRRRAPW